MTAMILGTTLRGLPANDLPAISMITFRMLDVDRSRNRRKTETLATPDKADYRPRQASGQANQGAGFAGSAVAGLAAPPGGAGLEASGTDTPDAGAVAAGATAAFFASGTGLPIFSR